MIIYNLPTKVGPILDPITIINSPSDLSIAANNNLYLYSNFGEALLTSNGNNNGFFAYDDGTTEIRSQNGNNLVLNSDFRIYLESVNDLNLFANEALNLDGYNGVNIGSGNLADINFNSTNGINANGNYFSANCNIECNLNSSDTISLLSSNNLNLQSQNGNINLISNSNLNLNAENDNIVLNSDNGQTYIGGTVMTFLYATGGAAFIQYTTAQINGLTVKVAGQMVFNSTIKALCFYDGTDWKRISHAAM